MKRSGGFIAGLALAGLAFAAPASAQDSGSMQVGNATISVGTGAAILGLPDVEFGTIRSPSALGTIVSRIKTSDDFIGEYGRNVNASVSVPTTGRNGEANRISVNGFWVNIDDDDTVLCSSVVGTQCTFFSLFDVPGTIDNNSFPFGSTGEIESHRVVDHWGVSLESKWRLTPGVMGVTRAPQRRYFAVGADVCVR